ncbi:MAG TPA: dephospho-CoA kinase, partial [Bacteroidia bacterium]|nr:dephospho-CoA kinase [Bacteroidia bacterium]
DKNLDYVILVSAPEELRFKRVVLRDQITEEYVKKISDTQMSEEEKKQKADFFIVNDDSQLIIPQVLDLHSRFLSLAKNKK